MHKKPLTLTFARIFGIMRKDFDKGRDSVRKLLFFGILLLFALLFFLFFDFDRSSSGEKGTTEMQTTEAVTTTAPDSSTASPEPQPTDTDPVLTEPTTTVTTAPVTTTTDSSSSSEMLSTLAAALSQTQSQNVFVYDLTHSTLLGEVASTDKICPASVTKLLTALYALEVMPADQKITPGDELSLVLPGSSIAYVRSHHTLTLEMLIEGMLLPSGNDAAYVVAAATARYLKNDPSMSGEDAVTYFMTCLNAYAVKLGCQNTHFTVPDGLAGEEHYTCSYDLILIGEAALKNEIITRYASLVTDSVVYASGHTMTWNNTNQLLKNTSPYYSPYVTGLKTGSLTDNYCIYVSAEIDETTYLIGVFGAPESAARYTDTHLILNALLARDE